MNIQEITTRGIWDDFLARAQPNTFLHSWQWGEFQTATAFGSAAQARRGAQIWRLGIYDGATLCGIALIIKVTAKRGNFLFCPHGPIIDGIMNYESGIRNLVDYLKTLAQRERCSFVRFSPLMLKTSDHESVWRKLGFRDAPIHMHPELAWILDITPTKEELLKNMRKTTRYSIRKAEKDGVEVIKSADPADIEKFWKVYSATVDRQHFVPFSKEYLRKEFESFGQQGRATLFFGNYKDEVISAAIVIFEPWSGFYHHGASIPKYANVPASQLVQWHAICEAKQRGCARYNFWGVVPESAKAHPWFGLSTFKRGFGGAPEEYVHAQDLIISNKYWVNWTVERMRKWSRHL